MRTIFAALAVLLLAASAYAVDINEKAPAIKVSQWLSGEPVSLEQGDGKTVYVIDFWATWCPPCIAAMNHLSELQEKYKDRGVVIIGVTQEDAGVVKEFLEKKKVGYRIAIDDDKATNKSYRQDLDAYPESFIINQQGIVAWRGHPQKGLARVLEQVVAGAYDPASARRQEEALKMLREAQRTRDGKKAMEALDELIAINPEDYEWVSLKVDVLRARKDYAEILKTRRSAAVAVEKDPLSLNDLAWEIATDKDLPARDPLLALTCAQEAVRRTERKDAAVLDTLARAYFGICILDEAIATEKEALERATDADERSSVEATLSYYEQVQSTQKLVREGKQPATK